MANCSGVVVIPCPKDTVANLHLPHLKGIGSPTSSISKCILFKTPILSKNNFNLSIWIFCAILTEPILPDLIKICSTVRFDEIFLSQRKRIYNALKNSESDSVIKFKNVLKKIVNE